jgi:uncharacterized membrane protein YcaP (DUF421 family)
MDPLRIATRVLFGYVVLLALVRLSGKRTVKHSSPFDFTIALITGDMIDDLLWAEVAASQFVVGAGILFVVHTAMDLFRFRAGGGVRG